MTPEELQAELVARRLEGRKPCDKTLQDCRSWANEQRFQGSAGGVPEWSLPCTNIFGSMACMGPERYQALYPTLLKNYRGQLL